MYEKPRTILTSTFSPSMLPPLEDIQDVRFERFPLVHLLVELELCDWESAIPHLGMAETLTEMLGIEIPVTRRRVQLMPGTRLLVIKPAAKIDWAMASRSERDAVKFNLLEVSNWTAINRLAA